MLSPSPSPSPDIDDVSRCIEDKDFLSLKSIGINKGFGGHSPSDPMRLQAYALLLGCGELDDDVLILNRDNSNCSSSRSSLDSVEEAEAEAEEDNIFTKLITRDAKRNGYSRWNVYVDRNKEHDLQRIHELINDVFTSYKDFNYIQGIDSVFAVFYVICNGNLKLAKKLLVALNFIFKSDLSLRSNSFGHLNQMWTYLRKYDYSFYKWLSNLVGETNDVSFALEWYIAWFAHTSIRDFETILRIYDFMIASQNQCVGLYMVVAVLLNNKKRMMEKVKSLSDLIAFCRIHISFDDRTVTKLIAKCYYIMQSEIREEERRNEWKNNKMEALKKWRSLKTIMFAE